MTNFFACHAARLPSRARRIKRSQNAIKFLCRFSPQRSAEFLIRRDLGIFDSSRCRVNIKTRSADKKWQIGAFLDVVNFSFSEFFELPGRKSAFRVLETQEMV